MPDAGPPAPTGSADVDAWLRALPSFADGAAPAVLFTIAGVLAARLGLDPSFLDGLRLARLAAAGGREPGGDGPSGRPGGGGVLPELPSGVGPGLLGQAHEVLHDRAGRRRRGVFYTPADVARRLVQVATLDADPWRAPRGADASSAPGRAAALHLIGGDPAGPTVCDPACGGGAFLLAAAMQLRAAGVPADEAAGSCLWGVDVDPTAVAVAEAVLALWVGAEGGHPGPVPHLVVADTLLQGPDALADPPPTGFDLVVGNPPFLNQLERATTRTAADRARLRERFGDAAFRYTDSAALFLVEATRLVRPGGRVALVLPDAVLVAADARRARDAALTTTRPVGLWWAGEPVFAAGVRVCAPVLERVADAPGPVDAVGPMVVPRWRGRAFEPAEPVTVDGSLTGVPSWAALTAGLTGVPAVTLADAGVLGSFCRATAGFRDQYYGLTGHVHEAGTHDPSSSVPLVTSGLIDPGRCDWGRRPTRFRGRTYRAPVVDLAGLRAADPGLAAWADARLEPKVVVATQTRVVEAAVDVEGRWFPSVPTIAVTCAPDRLWHAAAVLLAPPVSAWALGRHTGAALSSDALKLSARQVLELPLPADPAAWDEGAALLRAACEPPGDPGAAPGAADLAAFGAVMTRAYGAPDEVLTWWRDRLPDRTGTGGARRRRAGPSSPGTGRA